MIERRCYTPDEYADKVRVSVRTVYRLIKAGKLSAERVGMQWRIYDVDYNTGQRRTTHDNAANS